MSVTKHIKSKFFTGLFILIPLIVTLYIIYFVISFFEPLVAPLVKSALARLSGRELYIPGAGFILFIIITYITGILASNYFGKKALARGEQLLKRIPVVKSIYGSVKDMTEAFSSDRIKSFKEVVLVEYPFPGRYAIGFVTKRIQINSKQLCSVFIPTTPNPTSGYIILVQEEELTFLDIPADDALKYIISLGTARTEAPWKEKKPFLS
ncbi:MAG TPA: DUF502 domain-containing protein [Syntrophorhabdaceae bacterium]|nr:DUF502 domain-containing protein [Syntrophorhabdaceae bacterium]